MGYSPQNSTFLTLEFFLLPRVYHFRSVQAFSDYADRPQFTARQRLSYVRGISVRRGCIISLLFSGDWLKSNTTPTQFTCFNGCWESLIKILWWKIQAVMISSLRYLTTVAMIHVQAQALICLTALPSRILDSSELLWARDLYYFRFGARNWSIWRGYEFRWVLLSASCSWLAFYRYKSLKKK